MIKLAKKTELDTRMSYGLNSGWVVSDGATSNRAIIQVPGARGNLAGAPVASWVGWIEMPPAVSFGPDAVVTILNGSAGGSVSQALWIAFYASTINFSIDQFSASGGGGDWRKFTSLSTFRTAFANQRIWFEVRFTRGTANPVVRVNGRDVSNMFATFTNGTPPEWLQTGLAATVHQTGYNWIAGTAPQGCWLNAHLTDAESETWRITGRPPGWVTAGGTRESLVTGDDSTFASNTGRWALGGGVTISGGVMAYSGSGGNTASLTGPNLVHGQRYRITATAVGTVTARNAFSDIIYATFTNQTLTVEFTAQRGAGGPGLIFNFPAAGSIDDVLIEPLGALSLPSPQTIAVLDDITTLGNNPARLLGMTPMTNNIAENKISLPATAYTTTSTQILGGAVIGSAKQRLVSVSGNSSASVNISLGTTNGGTQLINAQAINGDFDITTFASRIIAAGASLWITFSGNTTASVIIKTSDLL